MFVEGIPEVISQAAPATSDEIASVEKILKLKFPEELRLLLSEANGVEANLVQFYSCEDMPERNETYEVAEYAPGYILFGVVNSFPVLVKEGNVSAVYENDWGAMTPDCMELLAPSLKEWINKGCPDT